MFNDKNDGTSYHPYAQCLWDRDPHRDCVDSRIHIDQMNTMLEGGNDAIGPPTTVPVYQGESFFRSDRPMILLLIDAFNWKEQLERNKDPETARELRNHRDIFGTGHTMETHENSGFSEAVFSDEKYTTVIMSETPMVSDNLLSPYSGLDGNRRSHSDTSTILTRPAPAISYLGHSLRAPADSVMYREGSGNEITLNAALSQRLSPSPNMHVSTQWHSSYLSDVDSSPEIPIVVLKQDVTSERMMKASQHRRKKEAKYECPVAGCGTTFTRRVNLNGHIRAHSDERPFVCSWVGCGKAFVRVHDHKRHQQLHTIERPFSCDACKRKFTRLDAVHRHCEYTSAIEQGWHLNEVTP
ncbi:hypothetical protein MVEN_01104900 [Mycena venus]|uniref:C2H2-type domain-containing protein n=1 Tax=Mycena venus TaxID=2733690 RepID=A0A8H6Y973_9AGAR|nr:hypothetical protein MVEN_01104900 [Mycena venus]